MDDAQTWTLIAGFLAIMVAMSGLLLRVVKTEIGSVRSEIGSVRSDLRSELTQALAPVKESIARLEVKVDNLDRDVQTLYNRQFGEGTG